MGGFFQQLSQGLALLFIAVLRCPKPAVYIRPAFGIERLKNLKLIARLK